LSFTPEQSAFVANRVESGSYQSVIEVVRHALRLLEDLEAEWSAQRDRVQHKIWISASLSPAHSP
jgi:putative addiction module CopG family antidote